MNITLIGMAGAGKSYIGKHFAERYGLTFVDIDTLLAAAYRKPVQSILDELGEAKFLDIESEMLIADTSGRDDLVISPGGSIIYRDKAMDHAKDMSTIVYLKVPFETIEMRLKKKMSRGLVGLGGRTLRELYDERMPLYDLHADITIDTASLDLQGVLDAIIRLLSPVDATPGSATMARNG